MTLVELLAKDLSDWLENTPDGVKRRVLLWLDPQAQFGRLIPYLEPALAKSGIRLLGYDLAAGVGQFALKISLLRLAAADGERVVIYLPGFGRAALQPPEPGSGKLPDLWAIYEYRYQGCVWGLGSRWEAGEVPEPPTLLGWLGQQGLTIADTRTARSLAAGGRDSLLARYAERQRAIVPDHWPRPLRASDVQAALAGDARDTLRRLLAAPNNEVRRWGGERSLVLQHIADEYGLAPPVDDLAPEALADAFAIQMALAEAWDAFGRAADFPFLSRLPTRTDQRERLARFLREDVASHAELGPGFRRRMLRLESGYNLSAWAIDRSGQPIGLPLLARNRWRQFLERLASAAAQGWRAGRDLLLREKDAVAAAASGAVENVGALAVPLAERDTHWTIVADLAALAALSQDAVAESSTRSRAQDLIEAYTTRWWQIDHLHLKVRAAGAAVPELNVVRRLADQIYFDYASRVGDRFADLIEVAGVWPPQGVASADDRRAGLWATGGQRRAVIVCDALRWDVAQSLRERLGESCTINPVAATLPTDTEFGMAALLPLGPEPVTIEFGEGAARLTIRAGDGPNLATRDGRREFLRTKLAGPDGRPGVEFVELAALLQGAPMPVVPLLVVFDNRIDEQGHKGTEDLPSLVGQLVGNLQRAVERLHESGFGTVQVVTDHGFLLVPPDAVDALGTPTVPTGQVYHRDYRWAALRRDAPTTEVVRLPLPLAPRDYVLGLPRGLRTLMKAVPFLHGGLSLQECIIPHLVSSQSLPRARVGVDLNVTTARLAGGTVPLVIRPAITAGQPPLGGLDPIHLRVSISTVPPPGQSAVEVVEPIRLELRPDVEELRPPIYLKEGLGLVAGQELVLQALDAETGENMGKLYLTLLVDWD